MARISRASLRTQLDGCRTRFETIKHKSEAAVRARSARGGARHVSGRILRPGPSSPLRGVRHSRVCPPSGAL